MVTRGPLEVGWLQTDVRHRGVVRGVEGYGETGREVGPTTKVFTPVVFSAKITTPVSTTPSSTPEGVPDRVSPTYALSDLPLCHLSVS